MTDPTTAPTVPGMPELMTRSSRRPELRLLLDQYGGRFHGPKVEHLSMEEEAFWRFMNVAIDIALARETARADVAEASDVESLALYRSARERAEKAEAALATERAAGPVGLTEKALHQALNALRTVIAYQDGRQRVLPSCDKAMLTVKAALASTPASGWRPIAEAATDVLAERRRQVEAEGWTPEHDDIHADGQLAIAAACYATHGDMDPICTPTRPPLLWPWSKQDWKPTTLRRDLVKAGALILAEIERLDRLPSPPATADGE